MGSEFISFAFSDLEKTPLWYTMVVAAPLQRVLTAPAVAGAVRGQKRHNSMPVRSSKGKGAELVVEKNAPGEVDPFAEFKSVLGEDDGGEALYDPLRQGPLRYAWLDGGVPPLLSLIGYFYSRRWWIVFQVSRILKRGRGGIQSLVIPGRRPPELRVRWSLSSKATRQVPGDASHSYLSHAIAGLRSAMY